MIDETKIKEASRRATAAAVRCGALTGGAGVVGWAAAERRTDAARRWREARGSDGHSSTNADDTAVPGRLFAQLPPLWRA